MQVTDYKKRLVDANEFFGPKNYHYQNTTYKSGTIFDYWACGSAEKDADKNKFSGAYPAGFLKRWKWAFADSMPKNLMQILHVCAGRIPKSEGMTLDINPKYKPNFCINAEDFHLKIPLEYRNYFAWTLSDSPYNDDASKRYYGIPILSKRKMIRAMIAVTAVGGLIGVLDQDMPNQKGLKNIKPVAKIAVSSIPNTNLRIFSVYQKIFSDEKYL